ncbi:MAG: SMC-Scp complex subunit ScpB [Minisyncoccota bacterium]
MNIEAQIEAILFYKSEPLTVAQLAEILQISAEYITAGLDCISLRYQGTGLSLVRHNDTVMIVTAREASPLIERIMKEELSRDIGKAGIETLAIVLYRSPVTRSEIDYIRGVNSAFILRALMARGLIERVSPVGGTKTPRYIPTLHLLRHLGIARIEDMPDYNRTKTELETFEAQKNAPAPLSEQSIPEPDIHTDLEKDEFPYDDEV